MYKSIVNYPYTEYHMPVYVFSVNLSLIVFTERAYIKCISLDIMIAVHSN